MTLGEFLSKSYDASTGKPGDPTAEFADVLKGDAGIVSQARTHRARLTTALLARDHCSRIHAQALDRVLLTLQ